MNANVQIKTITVKANQTLPVACTGTYLLLQASTGTFDFSVDGGPFENGIVTIGINFALDPTNPLHKPFTQILFTDTSGTDNTIVFLVSSAPIQYVNPVTTIFQKDAPTFPGGNPGHLLLGGQIVGIPNTSGGHVQRFVIFHNTDPAVTVYVTTDGGGTNIVVALPPGAPPCRIDTSSNLFIINKGGAAMTQAIYHTPYYYS